MATYHIAVIPGDGIGPEIVTEALKVLEKVGQKFGHEFVFTHLLMGGAAYDAVGTCFPADTVDVCKKNDAVLLGAVGAPSGTICPAPSAPKRPCSKSAKVSACTPTCAPPSCTRP